MKEYCLVTVQNGKVVNAVRNRDGLVDIESYVKVVFLDKFLHIRVIIIYDDCPERRNGMEVDFLCQDGPHKDEGNLDCESDKGGNNGRKAFEYEDENNIHQAVRYTHRKKLAEDNFRHSAQFDVESVINAGGKQVYKSKGSRYEQFALPVKPYGKNGVVSYDETFIYGKRHKSRDYQF